MPERSQLLLAFSDSGLVQDICLSPVFDLAGDTSPIKVTPLEAYPAIGSLRRAILVPSVDPYLGTASLSN
jgi:hypothetical protein